MSFTGTWTPGLIVLGAGLSLALAYVVWSLRRTASAPEPPPKNDQLADLEQRVVQRLDQLRELTAERHRFTEEQFAAEKARLEALAAAALKERDAQVPQSAATPQKGTGYFSQRPQLAGALWGAGIVLFFGAIGLLLTREQKPRDDTQMSSTAPPREPAPDPALTEAFERVQKDPRDVDALSALGHQLLIRSSWDDAVAYTHQALGLDPFHVESRIHRAVLEAVRGERERGIRELEMLADTYPDAQEALLFLGILAAQSQDNARALEHFERFAAETPPAQHPPELRETIGRLRGSMSAP